LSVVVTCPPAFPTGEIFFDGLLEWRLN
jgi:hypothetical protein